jgi:hypothetical protein
MRTTLDIDDDVLQAARELARSERRTAGKVISTLVRQALNGSVQRKTKAGFVYKNGVPVLPHREGEVITMEHIQKIMDEEGI